MTIRTPPTHHKRCRCKHDLIFYNRIKKKKKKKKKVDSEKANVD